MARHVGALTRQLAFGLVAGDGCLVMLTEGQGCNAIGLSVFKRWLLVFGAGLQAIRVCLPSSASIASSLVEEPWRPYTSSTILRRDQQMLIVDWHHLQRIHIRGVNCSHRIFWHAL